MLPGVGELRSALAFLTVLPVADRRDTPGDGLGRAFFPAVGLLLGGAAWTAWLLVTTAAGPWLGAIGAVAALALLTGALHLDGLADAADGLFGGNDPETRLAIMRDPRIGAFGVVAVTLVLLGDVAALVGRDRLGTLAALLGAGALARLALLAVVVSLPYVRTEGLGVAAAGGRRARDLALGSLAAALPLLLDWRHGLAAVALVALSTLVVAGMARRRVGGTTGDVYGAVVEIGQLSALLGYSVHL